jgi:Domain of unknown function (DUF4115)
VTAGLVAAGIVLIIVVVLAVRWRSGTGEQQALRHYQNALDTLRTVSDRLEPTRRPEVPRARIDTDRAQALREVASRAAVSARRAPPSREAPRRNEPVQQSKSAPDPQPDEPGPEAVLVFDDDSATPSHGSAGSSTPEVPARAARIALQRSSRPPSRVPAVLGILLVLVLVVVGIVLAVDKGHHSASPASHSHKTTVSHRSTTSSVSVTTSTVPPTTAPPSLQPEQATATAQSATYTAPDAPYDLTLTSSGACWVYASEASTGAVLWTGVLQAGQVQSLNATGQVTVKLGHANTLAVKVNGVAVDYPTQYQAVFTLQFVPSAT